MPIDVSAQSHDWWWLNPWLMMVKSMGDDDANPCSEPFPGILLLSSEFHMLFDILWTEPSSSSEVVDPTFLWFPPAFLSQRKQCTTVTMFMTLPHSFQPPFPVFCRWNSNVKLKKTMCFSAPKPGGSTQFQRPFWDGGLSLISFGCYQTHDYTRFYVPKRSFHNPTFSLVMPCCFLFLSQGAVPFLGSFMLALDAGNPVTMRTEPITG